MKRSSDSSPISSKVRGFWFLFAFIVVGSCLFHFIGLSSRPLHNDEGVNFYFLQGIDDKGYYDYSHENYHGPAYFYWSYLWYKILGPNEVGLRASAAFTGSLLLFVLLPLRRSEGERFVLITALLVALSTSNFYYSRYAIHETLFLLSSMGVGIATYLWWRYGRARELYAGFLYLALVIATKETFIVSLFCVGLGVILLMILGGADNAKLIWGRLRSQSTHLYIGGAVCLFLICAFFTGGFQWYGGLREMIAAVPQWIGRNNSDTGHFKPFSYYTKIMLTYGQPRWFLKSTEPWLALVPILPLIPLAWAPGAFFRFCRSERGSLPLFLFVWSLLSYLVYSFLNYKTPWLIINITLPGALFLGWMLSWLWEQKGKAHYFSIALCGLILGVATQKNYLYSFQRSFGNENPFSYVHTSQGMLDLVRDIDAYLRRVPSAKILVGVDGYWPLPFYLRKVPSQVAYLANPNIDEHAATYNILILEKDTKWSNPDWGRKYYRLSDVEETYTYFKRVE